MHCRSIEPIRMFGMHSFKPRTGIPRPLTAMDLTLLHPSSPTATVILVSVETDRRVTLAHR